MENHLTVIVLFLIFTRTPHPHRPRQQKFKLTRRLHHHLGKVSITDGIAYSSDGTGLAVTNASGMS